MKISRIILLLFLIILTSCNVVQEENTNTSILDNDVIVISDSLSTYPIKNYISRYNDGNLEQQTSFETKSDVGYHYAVDNGVYLFNSGLYYVDFQSKIEVEKLSDLSITDFCKDNDDIYYYENIGFNEKGYQGNIYKNNELILNLG